MALTVVQPHYVPYDHWREDMAANILVPMLTGALERQRQRDENRKQNVMRGEVLKQLGDLYQTGGEQGSSPLANLPEPEGYNSNPWAKAAHQNGSPLAQFDANMTSLIPPSTQRKVPNMQDIYNTYGRIAADPRFSMVSPEWIDQAAQNHMKVAEAQRMNDLRGGYADRYGNAGTWDDRMNVLTQANIEGAADNALLTTVSDYSKYRQPNYQPYTQNRGGSTSYGSFNPATGEWTQYGEYDNTLTPQEQRQALQWNRTFEENNRRFGIEREDKRTDATNEYELKKRGLDLQEKEIEARTKGQISQGDQLRVNMLSDNIKTKQNAILKRMELRDRLPKDDPQVNRYDAEIAQLLQEIENDRNEINRILGLQQGNTQQSSPTDMPPVPEQYRPQGMETQPVPSAYRTGRGPAIAAGAGAALRSVPTGAGTSAVAGEATHMMSIPEFDVGVAPAPAPAAGLGSKLGGVFKSLASKVGGQAAIAILSDMLFPKAAGETPEELEALRHTQSQADATSGATDSATSSNPSSNEVPQSTQPQSQPTAQNNGSFWNSIAGLFGATPAYADEAVPPQSNNNGANPTPQLNTTISIPHDVGGLITSNNRLNVTTPFHKQRIRQDGSKRYHDAVDYAIPGGTELRVPDYGVPFTVTRVRNDKKGYGNYVDLSGNINGHKVDLRLAHLQNGGVNVEVGQTLNPGDLIGLSGNTGNSRGKNGGYHLHLETRVDGKAVDPRNFMLETNSSNLLADNNAPEVTGTTFNGEVLPGLSPNGVLGASLTPMGMSGGAPASTPSTPYADIIDGAAQKYGIDNELIQAIVQVESDWNPNAKSNKGAMGLMQLMPDTARSLGVRNAYDPAQNIEGGSKYIAQLINRYGGDVSKALMAYNCGPGKVKRGRIPKASRAYANKVMGIYNRLKGQRAALQRTQQPAAPVLQQQKAPDGSSISWVNSNNQPMISASGEPFTDDLYNQWAEMIDAGEYRDVGLNTRADLDKWLQNKGMRRVKPSIDRGLGRLNNVNSANIPADVYDADIAPEPPNPQTSPASFPAPSFTDELNGTRPQDLQGMLDDLNGIAYGENPGWGAAFHDRFGSPIVNFGRS